MVKIPPEILFFFVHEKTVPYSMKELIELAETTREYEHTYFTNTIGGFCNTNFSKEISCLLITPFKSLPLLTSTLHLKSENYKKVFEWRLKKGY